MKNSKVGDMYKLIFRDYILDAIDYKKDFTGIIRVGSETSYFTYSFDLNEYIVFIEYEGVEGSLLTNDMYHKDIINALKNNTLVKFITLDEVEQYNSEETVTEFIKKYF